MTAQALPRRRWVLDLSASALLLGVPIAGFWATFAGAGYLPATLAAAVIGGGIAVLGLKLRWGVLPVAAATLAAYFIFGGALTLPETTFAGFIPTLETLRRLALGVVTSWKQLLTTLAPVPVDDGYLLVPFLLTLVATVLTVSFALRLRHAAWALLPAVVFLTAEIALGASEPVIPVIQGLVFATVALAWLAIRQAWATSGDAVSLGGDHAASHGMTVRRVVAGAGVLVLAGTVGVVASAVAAPDSPRYVLRDIVIPPFVVQAYPSPLQSYRALVRDDAETTLFTVRGLPEGARVRIASMDAYNGQVYNVSDAGAGSSSAFTPLRSKMSADAEGTATTVRVEIGEYASVWLPGVGAATEVVFDSARADELRRAARYNETTETGVVISGLRKGDSYAVDTVIPDERLDASLAEVPFAPLRMPKQQNVPQEFADIASKAVAEATTPIEQARALQLMLADGGFFSHGLEGEVLSRAGHGAERISTMLGAQQMVGDDEQYATAMALLAREIGMPARVVMGFYPDEEDAGGEVFTATGDTLHAWVEIAFADVGWVPFDPTPPEDQLPQDQTTKPRADPKPQVLQPPPPEQQPVDLPPTVPDDKEAEDETPLDLSTLFMLLGIGAGILIVLALLAAPFIVIGAIKAARRRRRRAAERGSDQISGGWDELRDRAVDYGTRTRPGATRGEDAVIVGEAFAEPRVTTLADRADAEVFGPSDPSESDIDEFWRQVDEIVGGMGSRATFWRRVRARLSLQSLLAGTRFARPYRASSPRVSAPQSASDLEESMPDDDASHPDGGAEERR